MVGWIWRHHNIGRARFLTHHLRLYGACAAATNTSVTMAMIAQEYFIAFPYVNFPSIKGTRDGAPIAGRIYRGIGGESTPYMPPP